MITGKQVAEKAKSLLQMGTIPYVAGGETVKGMDCQGLVEWVLRELGMKSDYAGTNDMWRNMLSDKGTIEEGVTKYREIPLGALIFIVDNDGGEPAKYQGDGEGNCEHVYIKVEDGLLVHASASKGIVTTRTFADKTVPNGGPTHYGLIRGVDYGVDAGEETEAIPAPAKKWKPLYSHLVFREGDMGGGTREIQTGLNRLGYNLNADGEFGPLTEEAVMQFQITQGLEADGVVGKKTWAALIEAVNA